MRIIEPDTGSRRDKIGKIVVILTDLKCPSVVKYRLLKVKRQQRHGPQLMTVDMMQHPSCLLIVA